MAVGNQPNKQNKDISTIDASSNQNPLSILDRIEIGISKGLYVAPSELFLEKIKDKGFSNLKTYLNYFFNEISKQIESKTRAELAAINITDISSSSINENEVNEIGAYEYQVGRMMIFEMALDIRTIKANNPSVQFSDLNMPLSILQNLTDDLSFFKTPKKYKKEIACLKAEIEKTNILNTSEPKIIDSTIIEFLKGKTNQFNKAPLELVVNYFMQLAEVQDEPFLSREDVLKFIDKAFCGNNEIELLTLVNTKNKKGSIYKLFHNFFEECTKYSYESTNYSKKGDYVKLLTSNFANWKYQTVFDNFSNSDFKPWKKFKELK
jgi:hypothetical protein